MDTPQEQSDLPSLQQRIIVLEENMMHLDHLLDKLNQVVCAMQDRLDEQDRQLKKLTETLETWRSGEAEERSFEDERPPHY
jgi:uncharacterized coiled-coil protein SlyX